MEKLEFRALEIATNKMHYDICIMFCPKETREFRIFTSSDGEFRGNDKHFKIQQYTGLKDKKNKKIFEDDIVLNTEGTNKYRNDYQIYPIGTIEGAKGRPCICPAFPLQQRCTIYDISNETNKFEIIGNIHQNPELIAENE